MAAALKKASDIKAIVANHQKLQDARTGWCKPISMFPDVKEVQVAIVHTPCPDGNACKALLTRANPDVQLFNYDHSKPYRVDSQDFQAILTAAHNKVIGLFDVTPSPAVMRALAKVATTVIGLDHHPTPVTILCQDPIAPPNVFLTFDLTETRAGCMMVHDWIKKNPSTVDQLKSNTSIPYWLFLLNAHDVGQFHWLSEQDQLVRAALTAQTITDFHKLAPFFDMKFNDATALTLAKKGAEIKAVEDKQIADILKSLEVKTLDTTDQINKRILADKQTTGANVTTKYPAPCQYVIAYLDVPDAKYPTLLRDVVPEADVLACRMPTSTNQQTVLSLRTPSLSTANVGELAQLYGGGGHHAAAGLSLPSRYLS